MKPIHEFNDFLKKQIGNLHSSRENMVWILKIFISAENVSLRVCQKCVTLGMSTVYKFVENCQV